MNLDRARAALLVMDLQTDIVAMMGDAVRGLLERTAAAIAAARAAKVPVIYVAVGFRPGYPEVHPKHPSFGQIAATGRFQSVSPADIAPEVAPRADEALVVKHRVSAFHGTDLEVILRSRGIETLILTGLATSGVVLSTVRHAADHDYQVVVVKDCCGDRDDEVHRVLVEKVFPRQGTVTTAAELVAALGS